MHTTLARRAAAELVMAAAMAILVTVPVTVGLLVLRFAPDPVTGTDLDVQVTTLMLALLAHIITDALAIRRLEHLAADLRGEEPVSR